MKTMYEYEKIYKLETVIHKYVLKNLQNDNKFLNDIFNRSILNSKWPKMKITKYI